MSVNGTYVLERNENLGPFLTAIGVKEDKVEKMTSSKPTVTLTVAGGKLEIVSKGHESHTNSLTLGAPSAYTLLSGFEIEVNVNISGSTVKGTLKRGNHSGEVTLEFSDSGCVETFNIGGNICKRFYKRT